MILSEFSYKDATGWQIDCLLLNHQNLVVGMNAVGKSKSVQAIGRAIRFIKGDIDSMQGDFICTLLLENSYKLEYSFEISGGVVVAEILRRNNELLINRELYSAKMYGGTISPPASKLVIQVRRDTMLYPEIEEIIKWAEHTSIFVFSNITTSPNSLSPYTISNEPLLPVMYSSLKDEQRRQLLQYLQEMDYAVDRIEPFERENGSKTLLIHENGIDNMMTPFDLSNGMFRVFCVLLFMIYSSTLSDARCMIVDDLGEGLDYMRSTRLGKLMFDYCRKNGIQLIVTSNDSFLMDTISLEYWNILRRTGSRVSSLNCKKDPELFEKFARTGLSNFDMLSSNFVVNHKGNE